MREVSMLRFQLAWLLSLIAITAMVASAMAGQLETGAELFRQNEIKEARPHFEKAVRADPDDADAHAWLAEALRRLQKPEAAAAHAQDVLDLDPCHSFAHVILAHLYYISWPDNVDDEKAWEHVTQAVECDPEDGNAWYLLWRLAIRRGDTDREAEAIRRLSEIGFITPAALAHARWILRDVPRRAVLLVYEDMDTFPSLILQDVEGFRSDVAVVNYQMLNLRWYREAVARRHQLPMMKVYETPRTPDGAIVPPSDRVVAWWLKRKEAGILGRPFAVSVTVPRLDFEPGAEQHLVFAGSHFRHEGDPEAWVDTTAVRLCLLSVKASDFAGPMVSERDRSPIQARSVHFKDNVWMTALQYAHALVDYDEVEEAKKSVAWAKEYGTEAGGSSLERPLVEFDIHLARYHIVRAMYLEAEQLLKDALTWFEENADSRDDPGFIALYEGMAALDMNRGDYDEAEGFLRQVIEIKKNIYGPEHPATADSYDNLAVTLQRADRPEEAIEMHREACAILESTLGKGHPRTATCLNNLGFALVLKGDYEEAEPILREALTVSRKTLEPGDPSLAFVLDSLGDLLIRMEEPAKAETLLIEAMTIWENSYPEGNPNIARGQYILGLCLTALERYEEAEGLLLKAHSRYLDLLGEDDKGSRDAREGLVTLYEAWEKPEKAREFRGRQ
jgi:tetratricopeptide (TPR) repeat protein